MSTKTKEDEATDAMKKQLKDKFEQAQLDQKSKDHTLVKEIVDVLGQSGAQRVLLAGKAGIGKTRLAKKVGNYAIENRHCFMTICVHLNKKFVDELSLYENIASQLCVYSDFEETEVDDRDEEEDEEKKPEEVLADLKKRIKDEIESKRKAADKQKAADEKEKADKKEKAEKEAAANKEKTASDKKKAEAGKEKAEDKAGNVAKDPVEDTSFKGQPYLLLILDDEGIKVSSEDQVKDEDPNEDKVKEEEPVVDDDNGKDTSGDNGTSEGNEITEVKESSGEKVIVKPKVPVIKTSPVASADWVMKDLKFEEFLRDQKFLKDCSGHNRLKVLVTIRKGDEESTKIDESTHTKSQDGDEEREEEEDEDEEKEEVEEKEEEEEKEKEKEEEEGNKDNKNNSNEEIKLEDGKNKVPEDTQVKNEVGLTAPYGEIFFKTTDKSEALLKTIHEKNLKDLFVSLTTVEWIADTVWILKMVRYSNESPAAIFVLANSLRRITPIPDPAKIKKLKERIAEVLSADRSRLFNSKEMDSPIAKDTPSESNSPSESTINPVLHLAYELLITDGPLKDAILDCFWHSLDFFEHCGCVYYRDLITQWILEGYFDPVRSVEKAYQEGHSILMELINLGMLKIQENNVVVPERTMRNLLDPRRSGIFGRSRLRFSKVYRGDKKKGLGKISQIDDMLKTVQAKKGDNISTLLVSGDRLRRETPEKFFAKLEHLEVLGLFEPTMDPFIPALEKLSKKPKELSPPKDSPEDSDEKQKPVELRVLVIRDCDLLKGIDELTMFGQLNVLEVSGASSVKDIPHLFFSGMTELQTLHLSGLRITYSPSSISLLKKLHCLIIKDCPLLKDLPNIQELVELEVVDVSGAHGLQTCFDNKSGDKKDKSKNKNFYHLTKLKLLDFSESQIERLPIFQDYADAKPLHSVTRLLLRDCSKLRRLPSLKPLSGLQILDLSGTTSLVEMLEVCFEEKRELKTINFSGTSLSELATTIEELTGLTEFLLKDCTNIESIPNINPLKNLEVFDVSGSTKLNSIEVSFEEMHYLRIVNLSGTNVETPKLPTKSNILGKKCITLANGMYIEGEDWEEVKAKMPTQGSDEASSSAVVVDDEEISETKPQDASESATDEIQPIQPNQPLASVPTESEDVSKERLLKVPKENLYKKTLGFFKSPSQLEFLEKIMEINETNVVDEEALAKSEFVSFVDCSSKRITSIFNKTKSVKGCSLTICMDISDLFTAVDVERLELLETLSITNLPLLDTINCGGSLKNLRELTVEYCPYIIMLFPEPTQVPSSLKVVNVKFCEKLEKVAEGVELSTFTKSEAEGTSDDSDWVVVDHSEISSQG